VKGFSKAIYKSFATRDEANAFLQANSAGSGSSGPSRSLYASSAQQSPYSSSSTSYGSYRSSDSSDNYSSSSHSGYSVPPQSLPVGGTTSISLAPNPSSNPLNESSHASSSSSVPVTSKDTIIAYTDGACSRNGQKGSAAGIGVYFGPNDPRNLSEPLTGTKQTNQRAELMVCKTFCVRVRVWNLPLRDEIRAICRFVQKILTITFFRVLLPSGWSESHGSGRR
jgi:ribonuclease HI